ncbi:hypothetical protein [Nocardia gamkensis]|uniref:Uncharacterized protein n=1 Tax=Nocardia gamkensis TaxID=352869 RepID=A0A7X6R3Y0_9NOCA|nr:hypothetical protein [Nocardia gamkensis]NKY27727.1 hypothetical protein [Nocardia gamkensis]NQE67364.1 hypothetical protein [Nocardia gamkensis]
MSKTGRSNPRRADREAKRRNVNDKTERHITVRSDKRNPPDLYKLSRAVIAIAMAEAKAEEAAHRQPEPTATVQAIQKEFTDDDE